MTAHHLDPIAEVFAIRHQHAAFATKPGSCWRKEEGPRSADAARHHAMRLASLRVVIGDARA